MFVFLYSPGVEMDPVSTSELRHPSIRHGNRACYCLFSRHNMNLSIFHLYSRRDGFVWPKVNFLININSAYCIPRSYDFHSIGYCLICFQKSCVKVKEYS